MTEHIRYHGVTLTPAGWSKRTGIRTDALLRRLRAGWSVRRALTTPPRKGEASRPIGFNSGIRSTHYRCRGTVLPLKSWAKRLGVADTTLYTYVRQRQPIRTTVNGRVVTTVLRRVPVYRYDGRTLSAAAWAKRLGIGVRTFQLRLRQDIPMSEKFARQDEKKRLERARLAKPKRRRKRRTAGKSAFSRGMSAGIWIVLGAAAVMLEQDRTPTTRKAIRRISRLFDGGGPT